MGEKSSLGVAANYKLIDENLIFRELFLYEQPKVYMQFKRLRSVKYQKELTFAACVKKEVEKRLKT